jgi:uncharacterized membrane protein YfbV (UPF0208 family)
VNPEGLLQTQKLEENDAGGGRAGRRLVRVLDDLLTRVRREGERIIVVSEGVEAAPWRKRAALGFTWPFTFRVALVFTDSRLIEVALSPWGRRCTGLIRELSWAGSPRPSFDGRNLMVGEGARWWLRRPLGKQVISTILQAVRAETDKAGRASTGEGHQWRICPMCGVTVTAPGARCRRCGSLWRSRRLASILAIAFPGGGKMFLGRPFQAIFRFILEVACLALVWDQLLRADSAARTVAVAGIAVVLGVLLKAESVRLARVLAERTGTISEAAARRWRRLVPVAALVSLIAITTPLFLGGLSGTEITADLEAEAAHLGWSVSRAGDQDSSPQSGSGLQPDSTDNGFSLRGVWRQEQGLEVRARAQPFLPFESLSEARERWLAAYLARQPVETGLLQVGGHDAIRIVERVNAQGSSVPSSTEQQPASPLVRLELLLFDGRGRDTHTLTTVVAETELPATDRQLQQLLRCMFWIDAHN